MKIQQKLMVVVYLRISLPPSAEWAAQCKFSKAEMEEKQTQQLLILNEFDGGGGVGGGVDGGGGNGDHAECKKNHVSLKMRPI